MVTFSNAVKNFYANAFRISGRATRAEYGWPLLFIFCTVFLYFLFSAAFIPLVRIKSAEEFGFFIILINVMFYIVLLGHGIPMLFLQIRRCHDFGMPTWLFITLYLSLNILSLFYTPFLIFIIPVLLLVLPGNTKRNKYGPVPYSNDTETEEKPLLKEEQTSVAEKSHESEKETIDGIVVNKENVKL